MIYPIYIYIYIFIMRSPDRIREDGLCTKTPNPQTHWDCTYITRVVQALMPMYATRCFKDAFMGRV